MRMNSPNKFVRKQQLTKPLQNRISRLRGKSDQLPPICYISPKKKQKIDLDTSSMIENAVQIKIMNIIEESQQVKLTVNQLEVQNQMLKQQLTKLKTDRKLHEINKSQKENILEGLLEDNNLTNQQSRVKILYHNNDSNISFKNQIHNNQNQQINTIKIETILKTLKQANKTIAKLKIQLNSSEINREILQHKLEVKQKMILKIKQRECLKIFSQISQNSNKQSKQNFFQSVFQSKTSKKSAEEPNSNHHQLTNSSRFTKPYQTIENIECTNLFVSQIRNTASVNGYKQ